MGTICLKLLLRVALIFTVLGTGFTSVTLTTDEDVGNCTFASPEHRLQLDIMQPKVYNIEVTTMTNLLHIQCKIMLEIHQPTRIIRLYAYKIQTSLNEIELVPIEEATKKTEAETQLPVNYYYCKNSQILELHFKKTIKPAHYYLEMKIVGCIQPFVSKTCIQYDIVTLASHERWFYTNLLKPIKVRRLVPCWDEPEVKATFNISVMHPAKYKVIFNTPTKEQRIISDEWIWTYFMPTPPISTSDLAIVITDNTMNYTISTIFYSSQSDYIWYYAESKVGLSYAFHVIDSIKWSLFKYTNMTSTIQHMVLQSPMKVGLGRRFGLIIYRKRDLLYYQNEDFEGVKINIMLLIAKQLAYHTFINVITQSSWYDAWISDSFTTFFSYFLLNEFSQDLKQLFAVQILQNTLYYENVLQLKPVAHEMIDYDEIDTALYSRFYHNKGVVFLRMLQQMSTPQLFEERLKEYMTKYKSNSTTANNLWEILQGTDDVQKEWKPPVKDIMRFWSRQKYYPVLYVAASDEDVKITSSCVKDSNVLIPINISISTLDYDTRNVQFIWMQCNDVRAVPNLQRSHFIMLNLAQVGYYRVNYEVKNWHRIMIYLSYEDYMKISVENRAQLIDDAYYFVMADKLDTLTLWNLVRYLKRETNYVAWYPMFNILFYMSAYWKFPASAYAKTIVVDMLEVLLENIGYEEHDSNNVMTSVLRLLASKWSCQLGSNRCREVANVKLLAHYYSPKTQILPWWKEWVYSMGVMQLNESTWDNILHESLQSPNITVLKYLGRTNDDDLILYYLHFLRTDKDVIKLMGDKRLIEHYRLTLKKHLDKDKVRKYVLNHFKQVIDRFFPSDIMVLWGDIIWNIYYESEIKEVLPIIVDTCKNCLLQIIEFSKKIERRYSPGQDNIEKITAARISELKKMQMKFSMF